MDCDHFFNTCSEAITHATQVCEQTFNALADALHDFLISPEAADTDIEVDVEKESLIPTQQPVELRPVIVENPDNHSIVEQPTQPDIGVAVEVSQPRRSARLISKTLATGTLTGVATPNTM